MSDSVSSVAAAGNAQYASVASRSTISLGEDNYGRDISFDNTLNAAEQLSVDQAVQTNNSQLQIDGRQIKQEMGKDEYLKLLITQLQYQDPTKPMEDKEFISQMAQFSSLEQMTNMSQGFQSLASMLSAGQASSLLGREVDIKVGNNIITGQVDEVSRGDYPQVLVDGKYYDATDVTKIRTASAAGATGSAVQE